MRLSIIIPVYKVEKYIRDTLQSIYRQQYDENLFEVIVINDGTPDDSMRIVAEFTNKHANSAYYQSKKSRIELCPQMRG